jgi:DnaJ-domain-containing protein 1
VLEAYLDRMHPEWRDSFGADGPGTGRQAADGIMTEHEALEILGLEAGASRDEIIAAHRRLMQKLHPDRGGSDYLAAQINAAKDFLLNE